MNWTREQKLDFMRAQIRARQIEQDKIRLRKKVFNNKHEKTHIDVGQTIEYLLMLDQHEKIYT